MRILCATVLCAVLMTAVSISPVQGEESKFKITDYIPEKFEDFEWQIGGSADLSGSDVDYEEYTPWEALLLRHTHTESNRWNMRFSSYLSYDYRTVPQFLNFDMKLNANLSSSESESSGRSDISTYPGTGEVSYSKSDSWSHQIWLRPNLDAGKYLVADLFVSGVVSGEFMYNETPDGESYSRSDTRSFNDPLFREASNEITKDYSSDYRRYSISLGVLPGWGRVYEGIYASTAMYLVEELKKNGLLLREPNKNEMLKLSDLVYQNRHKHAIDDRLRRIDTFDEILGFLETTGMTDTRSNRGYLYIQDVWDYFPRDRRQFGWRARAGLRLEHYLARDRYSENRRNDRLGVEYDFDVPGSVDTLYNISTDRYNYLSGEVERNNLCALASFEYGYPLSRKWQLSVDGTAEFSLDCDLTQRRDGIYWTRTDSIADLAILSSEQNWDTDNSFDISLGTTLSYIYSSRTRLDFSVLCRGSQEKTEITKYDADGDKIYSDYVEQEDFDLHLKTTMTYRLSIPTTLAVTAGYYFDSPGISQYLDADGAFAVTSDGASSNSHRYSVSVSLNHYLY